MMEVQIKGTIIPNSDKRVYNYFGEDSTCPADIAKAFSEAKGEQIDIYINSGGGDILAANEIYALIKRTPDVRLHVVGEACSAATIIMCAAHCDISPTALIMIHNAAMIASGNHNDMEHAAETLRTVDLALCQAYVNKTGKPAQEWLALMEEEKWFTAQEAVELGLCDRIAGAVTNSRYTIITAEQRREYENARAKAEARLRLERIKMR